MTSLVQSSSMPRLDDKERSVSDCVEKDHDYAQRALRVPAPLRRKERVEWFYILDVSGNRPDELDQKEFRDIKESALRLPPTDASLVTIQRAFDLYEKPCTFGNLKIRYCHDTDIIVYSIRTPIEPRKR